MSDICSLLVCRCVRQAGWGDRVRVHFSARLVDSRGRVFHDSRVGELQQPIHFQVQCENLELSRHNPYEFIWARLGVAPGIYKMASF